MTDIKIKKIILNKLRVNYLLFIKYNDNPESR